MDHPPQSTLLDALRHVPDPRHARGKRHAWTCILGVIAGAVLSHQRSVAASAQWAQEHAATLVTTFHPQRKRVPSEATIRRALRHIDVRALETHRARLQQRPARTLRPMQDRGLQGYAVDGNSVRGAGAHGRRTLLVRLVRHRDGRVLAQHAVAPRQHEGKAIGQRLAGRNLRGMVVTLDAGLTDPNRAQHIRAHGGPYLMVVTRNQAHLYQDLEWQFDTPPFPCDRPWRTDRTVATGHGRVEERCVRCRDDLDDYLTWPDVQQVAQRTCERTLLTTGRVTCATRYARTSVPTAEGSAAALAQWWRGHWAIENKVQYVRDVRMGEDGHQMHTGDAPQVLAAVWNAMLKVLRAAGWTTMAAALRHDSMSVTKTLQLLGAG